MTLPDSLSVFAQRLSEQFPQHWESILQAMQQPHEQSIRINTLLSDDASVLKSLSEQGFVVSNVQTLPHAYRVGRSSDTKLSQTPEWKSGQFVIQSLSSQLASIILHPIPGQLILDACASPGSKTSHLAMMMENTGNIVANDVSWGRLAKLKGILTKLGVTNAVFVNLPAEVLWRDYENTFDHVLVDVPCSMEGRINLCDPESYADWSEKKIARLSLEQKGILRSAIRCVKPGGTVIYSTCTLAPEENEAVIDWILRKEPATDILPILLEQIPQGPILTQWHGRVYDPRVAHCRRILPQQDWEGFFLAKLSKRET